MANAKTLDANGYRKFGMIDKVAYGAGDFGCNMSFALKGTLSIFWMQFMGIDPLVMSGLLLVVQIWDAINDPVIGALVDVDKRKYKRGKFLTYIWVGSIGLTFAGALCFIPLPGMNYVVKCLLFVFGYIAWDAFYTIANVPYGSMLSLISNDPADRAQLSTWRSIGSIGGGILTQAVLPMLIYSEDQTLLGGRIFFIALVMGVIGFIAFQFMIRNTVVRVQVNVKLNEEAPKFNIFKAVGNFCRNRAALGATLAPVGMFLGMFGAGTAMQVMFQSFFQAAKISGIVSIIGQLGMFLFVPFINPIVKKFGKKEAIMVGCTVSVFAYVLMLVLPITPDGKGLAMFVACQLINALGAGIGTCLSWSLMADAIDYGEWKFGSRDEGTTYALHSFFRKLAQGVGPSAGLVLLTMVGYDNALKANQTMEVAYNMRYLVAAMLLFSAVLQFVGYVLIYNINKKTQATMAAELAARHGQAEK